MFYDQLINNRFKTIVNKWQRVPLGNQKLVPFVIYWQMF